MSAHRVAGAMSVALLLHILTNTLLVQHPDAISVEGEAIEAHRLTYHAIVHKQLPPGYNAQTFGSR